jgi:serine/threonine protein kinase
LSDDSIDDDPLFASLLRAVAQTPMLPSRAAHLVGTRLAHFQIENRLSGGGMGEVFLARDVDLERPVALKLLRPDRSGDPDRHSRLMREAQSAANLSHPNIAAIYEVGESEGLPYLAMELVGGEDLQARLNRDGPLPIALLWKVALGTAEALACAHENGVIHRDLKPANVMLTEGEDVKVLDFGIAKLEEHLIHDASGWDNSEITAEGEVVGTPAYMAPEQARGEKVDKRTDVFAWAALMHGLCLGEPPHGKGGVREVVERARQGILPGRSQSRPDLPDDLETIIRQAGSTLAASRHADGAHLADALKSARRQREMEWYRPQVAASGSRPRNSPFALIAAALIGALFVIGLQVLLDRDPIPVAVADTPLNAGVASIPTVSRNPYAQLRFMAAAEAFYDADETRLRHALDALAQDPPLRPWVHVLSVIDERWRHPDRSLIWSLEGLSEIQNDRRAHPMARALARVLVEELEGPSSRHPQSLSERMKVFSTEAGEAGDGLFSRFLFVLSLDRDAYGNHQERALQHLQAEDDAVPRISWSRARLLFLQNNAPAAEGLARHALQNLDGHRPHRLLLARAVARQKRTTEALSEVEKLLEEVPGDLEARSLRAELHLRRGHPKLWRQEVDAILASTAFGGAHARVALDQAGLALAHEDIADAERWIDEALETLEHSGEVPRALSSLTALVEVALWLRHPSALEDLLVRMRQLREHPRLTRQTRIGVSAMVLFYDGLLRASLEDGAGLSRRLERLQELPSHVFDPRWGRQRVLSRLALEVLAREGEVKNALAHLSIVFDGAPSFDPDSPEAMALRAWIHHLGRRQDAARGHHLSLCQLGETCSEMMGVAHHRCVLLSAHACLDLAEAELERRRPLRAQAAMDLMPSAHRWRGQEAAPLLKERAAGLDQALADFDGGLNPDGGFSPPSSGEVPMAGPGPADSRAQSEDGQGE